MEYESIPLRKIHELVPSIIQHKIYKIGFDTVGDLIHIDDSHISDLPGFGNKSINAMWDFVRLLRDNRDFVLEHYRKTLGTTIPFRIDKKSFGNNLLSVIDDYFCLLNQPKLEDIIVKRYGLKGNKAYSLEEIGVFYSLTRERIRQIQSKHINNLKELLLGSPLKKPSCICNQSMTDEFRKIRNELVKKQIVSEQGVLSLIGMFNIKKDVTDMRGTLSILTDLIGGYIYNIDGKRFYVFDNSIKMKLLDSAFKNVRSILARNIIPMKLFDLVLELHKSNSKITRQYVIHAVSIQKPAVEILKLDGEDYYQLEFSELTSLSNYAHRILYEKQTSLHLNDIWREIQHRLTLNNRPLRENKRSLNSQLVADSRFSPIGRSGQWSLREWGNSSSSIIELMVRAIYYHNHPCDIKAIENYVNEHRPQVSKHSIASIISQNQDRISRLEDGTFILTEWSSQYENMIQSVNRKRLYTSDFEKLLAQIFAEQSSNLISSVHLKKLIAEKGIQWADSTFYARFNNTESLQKKYINGKLYYSLSQTGYTPKEGKLIRLRNAIYGVLKAHGGGPILLKEVVTEMKRQSVPPHITYGVISSNKSFFRKTEKNRLKYVQIETEPSKAEHESQERDAASLMKEVESQTLEFKSSMRWDKRRNQVNPDLEFMILKTIAGFLNTDGGILLIGVDDYGNLIGLKQDYSTLKKKNADGFLLRLNDILIKTFEKQVFTYVRCSIQPMDKEEICLVSVKPSPRPVFIKKEGTKYFFIRANASVQSLDIEDVTTYISTRWGKGK